MMMTKTVPRPEVSGTAHKNAPAGPGAGKGVRSVYIHEAINARTADEPFIARKKWTDTFGVRRGVRLIPTCSPDGMILDSYAAKAPCRGWQPTAEDLTADDWLITA